jgi:hypothetical protein
MPVRSTWQMRTPGYFAPVPTAIIVTLLTAAWTTVVCAAWWPYTDWLTGFGWLGSFLFSALYSAMFGVALYLLFIWRRWRGVAVVLILVSGLLAFPMPSNAGVTLRLSNTCPQAREIRVQRDQSPEHAIRLTLQPGETRIYKTAPGDWPKTASFTVRVQSLELSRPLNEFRNATIVVSTDSLDLRPSR